VGYGGIELCNKLKRGCFDLLPGFGQRIGRLLTLCIRYRVICAVRWMEMRVMDISPMMNVVWFVFMG